MGSNRSYQREADRQFHALFIAHTGIPIQSLLDLKGRTFAFGDINSTSGHLMPFEALRGAGLIPQRPEIPLHRQSPGNGEGGRRGWSMPVRWMEASTRRC